MNLIRGIFKHVRDSREFNIIFVSNEEIQQINRDYRGIDRITDVISFALLDNDLSNYNAERELGDIFICVDRAKEQAEEYGHSLEREIGFLSVHGYLHLCGYDHMNPEDEKVMFAKQDEILNKAGLKRG
ncbi:MAG: rRNA maturation RNase YbeY [Acholeplasmatales bacterium]|nr:rRNA maturation RNase YbeY [Acholeplasmatales bacterium]